jgi:hypothetical protein
MAPIQFGKTYDDLKYAYQIAIVAKERFFTDGSVFHTFEYYDPVHGVSLKGRSRITTVELSKVEGVVEKPIGEMSAQEHGFFEPRRYFSGI